MKFNKKFLAKVAIFSAILGLNGMCFDNMVNCLESGKKKDVICAKCGRTAYFRPIRVKKNFFCLECITYASREVRIPNSIFTCTEYVLEPDFVKEYSLKKEDTESINQNIANQGFRVVRFEDQPLDIQEYNRASYDQRRRKKENNSKKVKVENKNPADKRTCSVCSKEKSAEFLCQGKYSTKNICNDCFHRLNDIICPFCHRSGQTNVIKNLEPNKEEFCWICFEKEPIELPCCKGRFLCKDCIFKLNKNRYLIFQIDENNEIFKIKHKK